jgi:hypothetical protein
VKNRSLSTTEVLQRLAVKSPTVADTLAELGVPELAVDSPLFREVAAERLPDIVFARDRDSPDATARKWAAWGIVDRVLDLVRDRKFRQTEAVIAARELVEEVARGARWCVLTGDKGTGKTVASAVWLNDVRARRPGPRMQVPSKRVAGWPPGTVWTAERIEGLVNAAVLVLDDVGFEDERQGRHLLHEHCVGVLSERYDAGRPTLANTNFSIEQLKAYLGGGRMTDRWDEVGAERLVMERVRPVRAH